ncbi:MAG: PACE efflux transporter [Actinobacteria bacterium]|nr:PACE efflux transporter [Actinomycetota bacterium]
MLRLSPVRRRVLYVTLYELIAVVLVAVFLMTFHYEAGDAFLIGLISSVVAVIWNYVWNTLFEWWEGRRQAGPRTLRRRIVHAVGFEGGLIVFLVPTMALILGVSLVTAFFLEAGQLVFFLLYTFVFAWCFDRFISPPPADETASDDARILETTVPSVV